VNDQEINLNINGPSNENEGKNQVTLKIDRDKIAILNLGNIKEKAIVLNRLRLESLAEKLDELVKEPPAGLIITGPSAEMFSVGADINMIANVATATDGEKLAKVGQELFNRIENLKFPVVAAISGQCLGGAFELALSCNHRICSDDLSTSIGLPEVKLGIIPGFGGTQRLPKLIGIEKSLDIILQGKTLRAKEALGQGLVSEVVAYPHLLSRAVSIIKNINNIKVNPLTLKEKLLTFTSIGRLIVTKVTEKKLARTLFPAPKKALDCVIFGLQNGIEKGLEQEAKAIGELIVGSESKALVYLFLLSEASKKLGKAHLNEISRINVIVVGAGIMGRGIATVLALKGISVTLKDVSHDIITQAKNSINNDIDKLSYLSPSEKNTIKDLVAYSTDSNLTTGDSNIVIEAVIEKLEIKQQIIKELEKSLPSNTIFASNTSSILIEKIGSNMIDNSKLIGMHFFNPVRKMPLVEIIRSNTTSDKSVALTTALAVKLGKFPVVVNDVAGFLVNRILFPYLNTALMLFAKGVSTTKIDNAALAFGLPMGPLRLLDEVGIDVAVHVSAILRESYGKRMAGEEFPKDMINKGLYGKKKGSGFYKYLNGKSEVNQELPELIGLNISTQYEDLSFSTIQQLLVYSLINEGLRCFYEEVAGSIGAESAGQIDLASVMGLGFPAFRGGLIYYANSLGVTLLVTELTKLNQTYGEQFSVPNILLNLSTERLF
jgi:3-hydroxyacyl-CoA dehydrogenase / enoyl-CoA hydratase / 3-hydroxybutyryl-CoA epimerase